MAALKSLNLAVRFLLELCALAGLGYWGYHQGDGVFVKIILGIGAPLLAAVIWGAFVAPKAAVHVPGWLHFLLELIVIGTAAFALYLSKQPKLAAIYAGVYVVNRILLTVWKQ
jgi:uncharacterized protein (DUF983 family)